MLRKLFLIPFFLFSLSGSLQAEISSAALQVYDLGSVEVEAPAWNHPEAITGAPDGETFFEILPSTGQSTLAEALDGQMGISLRSNGGAGTVAAISAGGLSGNKLLVVKDGLPVNDPFTGTPDIGDFSTVQYEQAEFWQGNRATLWGSSSIGGTLRLTSRFPDYGRLRVFTDGHGGNGRSFETRFEPGEARFGIRVSQFTTPGFSVAARENGNGERDGFESENGYAAFEADLENDLQLQMSSEFSCSQTDLDSYDFVAGRPVDNLFFRQRKLGSQFNVGLTRSESDGELKITHAFSHTNLTGIDESNPFNEFGLAASRQRQALSRSFQLPGRNFLVELSHSETRADNTGLFSHRESDNAGLIACENSFGKNSGINAVFRFDDPQNHSGVCSGNLALKHTVKELDFDMSWGRAFRMPALNERYYPAYGDPDLDPEFSTSRSLSVGRRIGGIGRISAGLSQYDVSDLIGTTATTDPKFSWGIKAANLDRAKIRSHQFAFGDCRVAGCSLRGDLLLTDVARLEKSGRSAPGIASRQVGATLERKVARTIYTCRGRWWGTTWEDAENTKSASPGHDISLFIKRNCKQCSFEVGLLNITGAVSQRVLGYTRPGRRLTLAFESMF